jgi:RNA recognition motif-containing protein
LFPLIEQVNDDRKLFVGNLAWAVDGLDLEDIFKEFGTVESAQARTRFAAALVAQPPVIFAGRAAYQRQAARASRAVHNTSRCAAFLPCLAPAMPVRPGCAHARSVCRSSTTARQAAAAASASSS